MSVAVPSILKYLSTSSIRDEESATPRAKKRRLDHLTWEEKLQRKKLKNRVAAQTSRDRKKQRMEQMENALQELFLKNEALLEEVTELREDNKKLSEENDELHDKIQKLSCRGMWSERTLNSELENTNANGAVENCFGLPSLPDLLNELDRDVDLDSLEELTQSLLQDIAADLEAAAEAANRQESTPIKESNGPERMVGSTPENVDACRRESLKSKNSIKEPAGSLFSQPLLHHDYSAKQRPVKTPSPTRNRHSKTSTKLKPIRPKEPQANSTLYVTQPTSNVVDNSEILYGTLDETTNCITIVLNDSLPISEAITEVETSDIENMEVICDDGVTMQSLKVPEPPGYISPAYSSSDCGYESVDSPHSLTDETSIDVWDHSVSELFPTLF